MVLQVTSEIGRLRRVLVDPQDLLADVLADPKPRGRLLSRPP